MWAYDNRGWCVVTTYLVILIRIVILSLHQILAGIGSSNNNHASSFPNFSDTHITYGHHHWPRHVHYSALDCGYRRRRRGLGLEAQLGLSPQRRSSQVSLPSPFQSPKRHRFHLLHHQACFLRVPNCLIISFLIAKL